MANKFSEKSAEELVPFATNVAAVLGSGGLSNPYGVDAALISALTASDTALTTSINAQVAADAVKKAATATKATKKSAVVSNLTAIADVVYPNPAVTDAMLVALGFSPRPVKTVTTPVTPTVINAFPTTLGEVKLQWARSGNKKSGVIFVVETSTDGTNWTFLASTTRVSYVATGFAPGVPAWFRVKATTSTASSLPSASTSIYAPGGSTELHLAA